MLEIVRSEATKVWTRYNDGKTGSYSTFHASVHENEMWNDILSAQLSSHCHLRKVAYLRCSFLVLSASSRLYWKVAYLRWSCLVLSASCRLYWKRSAPLGSGLWDYEQLVMPTGHLHLWSVIVIKCTEFDQWPHVILTSASYKRIFVSTITSRYCCGGCHARAWKHPRI